MGQKILPDTEELYDEQDSGSLESGYKSSRKKSRLAKYIAAAGALTAAGALGLRLFVYPVHDARKTYRAHQYTQSTGKEATTSEIGVEDDSPLWVDKDGWYHFKPNAKELMEKWKKKHRHGYDTIEEVIASRFRKFDYKFKIKKIHKFSHGEMWVDTYEVKDHYIFKDSYIIATNEDGKYYYEERPPVMAVLIGKEKEE